MFLPIRSDRRLHSTPWVNVTLIVINVIVFAFTHSRLQEEGVAAYFLDPGFPRLYQFITYQFMHANLLHLAGNMVFLYVFGNSIEDRLGKAGYLAFYLAGGVLSGLGHSMVETTPVLGASGAVAAVTGAYLALFPLSNVTLLYWFFIPGTFEVSGVVLILFQIATNFVMWAGGEGSVAYAAHLAGYTFGFFVGMILLWVRVLPREPYDMLALWEQRRRRERFRALTQKGYRPWEHEPETSVALADGTPSAGSMDPRVIELRARIAAHLAAHRLDPAAAAYEELMAIAPNAVLAQQQQIDVANQLMTVGKFHSAAQAYELFLGSYRADPHRDQVELILGVLCARYLNQRDRGRELLAAALLRLQDPQQRQLAQAVLTEIGG